MGIKLWLAPQISEHCPKKTPGRPIMKVVWFSRPGTASTFTPKAGTVQECRTSSAEIRSRTGDSMGATIRLSASRRRNCPGVRSDVAIM